MPGSYQVTFGSVGGCPTAVAAEPTDHTPGHEAGQNPGQTHTTTTVRTLSATEPNNRTRLLLDHRSQDSAPPVNQPVPNVGPSFFPTHTVSAVRAAQANALIVRTSLLYRARREASTNSLRVKGANIHVAAWRSRLRPCWVSKILFRLQIAVSWTPTRVTRDAPIPKSA